MIPTAHPSNNGVLGAPEGWPDGEGENTCAALAVTHTDCNGMPVVVSFWRPSAEELAALNAGQCVTVTVAGHTQPPIALGVSP